MTADQTYMVAGAGWRYDRLLGGTPRLCFNPL
jgi:hypothetical protein